MPVHWYYDRAALAREYGHVVDLVAPKNPHADSILWRSSYTAPNSRGEILHEQAAYWEMRGSHYHQFLRAGENTLNMQLALELLAVLQRQGCYNRAEYLKRNIDFMTIPGRHRDTNIEECHRNFFTKYARGKKPRTAAEITSTSADRPMCQSYPHGMPKMNQPPWKPCANMCV